MLIQRKVMKAACINTSWSEARCEESFTGFIVVPPEGPGYCTDSQSVVELSLTQRCVRSELIETRVLRSLSKD